MDTGHNLVVATVAMTLALPSYATSVIWADWQSSTGTTVTGSLATSTAISIDFSSPSGFGFVQTNGIGQTYWTEPNPASRPYTGGSVENAPPAAELIALNYAGQKTVTFGQPISGLYFYPLILRAIAQDPPELTQRYPNLQRRIQGLCARDQPSGSSVTGACSHIASIANESENRNIVEWDGENDVFDIRDPYLLFFLRWAE